MERPHVVAIGGSAGGIEALCKLLALIPTTFPAIILIVTHRSPVTESALQQVLARHARIPILLARDGQELECGVGYLGHPSQHLTLAPAYHASLVHDHFYRAHNIDALFNSVALNAGSRAVGIILSGMNKDGAQGLAAIKQAGGMVLVQSPVEAQYPDMPRAAIASSSEIDEIGPISALVATLMRHVGAPVRHPSMSSAPNLE